MVGRFDASHCGDCGACRPPCIEADTDSTLNTLSGSWSIGDTGGIGAVTRHYTSNTNAVRYTSTTVDHTKPWKATVTAYATLSADGGEHFIAILYAGAADTNNYVKLEFEFLNMGLQDDNYSGIHDTYLKLWYQARFYTVSSGTPTLQVYHPWKDSTQTYARRATSYVYPDDTPGSGRDIVMEICWDGERYHCMVRHALIPNSVGISTTKTIVMTTNPDVYTPTGGYAGFGTGGTLTDTSAMSFHSFEWARGYLEGEFEDCANCLKQCCGGPVPAEVVVAVTGSLGSADGGNNASGTSWSTACSSCGVVETNTLAAGDPDYPQKYLTSWGLVGPTVFDWAGDGRCYWAKFIDCTGLDGRMLELFSYWNAFSTNRFLEFKVWETSVFIGGSASNPYGLGSLMAAFKDDITSIPCEDWATPFDIPHNTALATKCGDDSLLAEISL